MTFKYFDKPELFVGLTDDKTKCDTCQEEKHCFEADIFTGQEEITSICPDCLANGKLIGRDIFTCDGDIGELKRQIKLIEPSLNESEIDELAKKKTIELEKKTPHLVTWQDWSWPCSDGDYCKFIGFGSKPFYNTLATGTTAEELFKNSFYYTVKDDSDIDFLWNEALPEKTIKDHKDSNNYGTLFYVFKSLNSDKIITIWDCD